MKYFIFSAVLFVAVGLTGCKKLIQFHMEYDNNITIPASTPVGVPFDIMTPETTTNADQQAGNNGTAANLITKISLGSLQLKILNPASGNFNFLKSVEIFLNATDLPEVRVAYDLDVPATGLTELPLTCTNADLKDYLRKPAYSVRVKALTDEALDQDTEINIHTKFDVDAGLF